MARLLMHALDIPESGPRLSPQEEQELIARMRPPWSLEVRDEARNELVVRHLKLVPYVARRAKIPYRHMDALASHLMLALVKAVDSYEPERGARLGSWLCGCLTCQSRDYVRQHELLICVPAWVLSSQAKAHPNFQYAKDSEHTAVFSELKCDEYDPVLIEDREDEQPEGEHAKLSEALDALDPKSAMILRSLYGIGREKETRREIAVRLGCTKSNVGWHHNRNAKRLKTILEAS